MFKIYRNTITLCLLFVIMLMIGGCAADQFSVEDMENDEVVSGNLIVTLNVSIEGKEESDSRSEDNEIRIPGTEMENRLSHGHLFLQDLEENGKPIEGKPMVYINVSLVEGMNEFTLKNIDFGKKRIYIAANLTDSQASHFANYANDTYTIPQEMINTGYNLINKYAHPDDNIAMFCTKSQDIEFLKNGTYQLSETFFLKRIVAKVHVTATTTLENNIEYCNLAGDMVDIGGWIRLNDVKYIVNGLNTKSYLMQVYDNSGGVSIPSDPNFSIDNNIYISEDNIDPVNYSDFYFHGLKEISDYNQNFVKAEKYDNSRIPVSNNSLVTNPYTKGLYCPENTFTLPSDETKKDAFVKYKSDTWPMVTHVIVSAKFTPKMMVVEKDLSEWISNPGNVTVDEGIRTEIINKINVAPVLNDNLKNLCTLTCISEKVAETVLYCSLKMNNFLKNEINTNGLVENTYFWNTSPNNLPKVFTYGAAKIFSQQTNDAEIFDGFSTVPAGVGYYYIYLDNTNSTSGSGSAAYDRKDPTNSIVERNAYYLVNIRSFSGPGDATLKGDNILVHTVKTQWKDGGKAEIELN